MVRALLATTLINTNRTESWNGEYGSGEVEYHEYRVRRVSPQVSKL